MPRQSDAQVFKKLSANEVTDEARSPSVLSQRFVYKSGLRWP